MTANMTALQNITNPAQIISGTNAASDGLWSLMVIMVLFVGVMMYMNNRGYNFFESLATSSGVGAGLSLLMMIAGWVEGAVFTVMAVTLALSLLSLGFKRQ